MTVSQYQQEQAEKAVAERWDTVMSCPAAQGREGLARSLLAIGGANRMTAAQIITALEKAPAPSTASPAAHEDPALTAFEAPGVSGGRFDPRLYAAGRASALEILGKKER